MLKTIFIFFIGLSEEIVGRLRFLRPRNKTIITHFLVYIHNYFEVKPFSKKIVNMTESKASWSTCPKAMINS